jgi:hypothetical protein
VDGDDTGALEGFTAFSEDFAYDGGGGGVLGPGGGGSQHQEGEKADLCQFFHVNEDLGTKVDWVFSALCCEGVKLM